MGPVKLSLHKTKRCRCIQTTVTEFCYAQDSDSSKTQVPVFYLMVISPLFIRFNCVSIISLDRVGVYVLVDRPTLLFYITWLREDTLIFTADQVQV